MKNETRAQILTLLLIFIGWFVFSVTAQAQESGAVSGATLAASLSSTGNKNAVSSAPAAPATASAEPESEEAGIMDNSFLVEEAYNQEYAVVQHIQMWTKMWVGNGWAYSFTQE